MGEEPPLTLTLPQCLEKVVFQHPSEQASQLRRQAALLRKKASKAYPNPRLSVESENIKAEEDLQMTYALTQEVELGGQRSARQKAAQAELSYVESSHAAQRSQLLSDISKAYADTWAAEQKLKLVKASTQLSEDIKKIAQQRVEAGKCAPLELDQALSELALTQSDLSRAQCDYDTAKSELSAYWLADELGEVALSNTPWPSSLPLGDSEFDQAILSGPECATYRADSLRLQAQANSIRTNNHPVIEIGGGMRRMGHDDSWVLSLGMELPLSNRGRQEAASAQLEADATEAEHRDSTRRWLILAKKCRANYLAREHEMGTLRNEVLPATERAYTAVERSYQEGKLGYLDILASKRSRIEVQHRLVELEKEWLCLRAELGRLCGATISKNSL